MAGLERHGKAFCSIRGCVSVHLIYRSTSVDDGELEYLIFSYLFFLLFLLLYSVYLHAFSHFLRVPYQVGYVGALIALGSILAQDGDQVGTGSALALVYTTCNTYIVSNKTTVHILHLLKGNVSLSLTVTLLSPRLHC